MTNLYIIAQSEDNILTLREYALAWKLHETSRRAVYHAIPKNDGSGGYFVELIAESIVRYTKHGILTAEEVQAAEKNNSLRKNIVVMAVADAIQAPMVAMANSDVISQNAAPVEFQKNYYCDIRGMHKHFLNQRKHSQKPRGGKNRSPIRSGFTGNRQSKRH